MSNFRTPKGGKPKPPNESGVPPLTWPEKILAGSAALGAAGVGGLGLAASFDTVAVAAERWGFSEPWMLPGAIDSAIPVFTVANLMLIRMDMALGWVRLVPWVLTLVTCALNVAAGASLWAKVAHGTMPLLWVASSEIAGHIYAVRIGAATNRRMEKVRRARWALSPVPTFLLWRRMQLWELTSYNEVLQLEQERLVYQAQLRSRFGRAWRRKAPVASLLPLRLVGAGVPLAESAPAGLRAAAIDPTGVFAESVEELPALPAPATPPAPAAVPATAPASTAPAAVNKPSPITATVQPQSQPQRGIPHWSSEDGLYEIIKDVIDNGHREVFEPGGPLTGGEIASVLGHSEGNGRKVRQRLIKIYAAERGVTLPPRATIDDVFTAFAHPLTAVSP
ncbi:DUF2637 domain-containing protein [Streptomyces sp. NBC_00620]|nr:DUF2637 domain-containing protein [Streptomyces sp. NBC_00620]WRZ26143.1 DUF2637 domain-containing protein [Streptomyces sp. NBC_00243]